MTRPEMLTKFSFNTEIEGVQIIYLVFASDKKQGEISDCYGCFTTLKQLSKSLDFDNITNFLNGYYVTKTGRTIRISQGAQA